MKYINFIFLITFYIISSCDKVEENESLSKKNVKKLSLNVENEKEFNYSQLFDSCLVVPLETRDDALIGSVDKVIVTEEFIVLLDRKMAKSIFIYGIDGKIKNIINKVGEGPGEYLYPFNVYLSESKKELIVFDSKNNKVVFYGLNGDFIKEFKVDMEKRYTDLVADNGKFYLAGGDYRNRFKNIRVVDHDFKLKNEINTYIPNDLWIIEGVNKNYFFQKEGSEGFYYKGWMSNKILEIVDDEIVEIISINLSENAFNFEKGKPVSLNELGVRLRKEGGYLVDDGIIDGKNFMLMTLLKGMRTRLALWDKTTDKIHCVRYLINDLDGVAFPKNPGMFEFNSNSNLFITMMYPSYFNEAKEKGIPESPYKERLEKIRVDNVDNPILFIYKFKEYFDE